MLRKLAIGAMVLGLGTWRSAFAVGLGEIDVQSNLNQTLKAVIPLTVPNPGEIDSLQVRMASPQEFAHAGLERGDYVSSLRFEVVAAGGLPQVRVSSQSIVREPVISFLLELRSGSSRVLREYTVLLDLPDLAPLPASRPGTAKPAPLVRAGGI